MHIYFSKPICCFQSKAALAIRWNRGKAKAGYTLHGNN